LKRIADVQIKRPFPVLLLPALALALALTITISPPSSFACVGRKLVLGSLGADRPSMVTRILSILIHERTGTTVEVEYFPDLDSLLDAVDKGKVDLYVDHVDSALKRMDIKVFPPDTIERFEAVKRRFEEELNLIWLKPMGYTGSDSGGRSLGAASIVVQKDTLKMFPALPRLLEKIGTRVILDDSGLDRLVARARSEKPAKVARDYLKETKLI